MCQKKKKKETFPLRGRRENWGYWWWGRFSNNAWRKVSPVPLCKSVPTGESVSQSGNEGRTHLWGPLPTTTEADWSVRAGPAAEHSRVRPMETEPGLVSCSCHSPGDQTWGVFSLLALGQCGFLGGQEHFHGRSWVPWFLSAAQSTIPTPSSTVPPLLVSTLVLVPSRVCERWEAALWKAKADKQV